MSKLFNVVMLSFMISLSLVNCVKTKEDYKKRNEIIQGITKAIYKKDNQLNCDGIKKWSGEMKATPGLKVIHNDQIFISLTSNELTPQKFCSNLKECIKMKSSWMFIESCELQNQKTEL